MKSLSSRKTVFLSLAVIALILLGWGYTSGFFFERGLTPCAPPLGVMVDGVARANVYTWLDENGNGISDPGESPLPGVEIVYPALSKPTNEQGQAETSQFKPGCACKCWENEYVAVRAPEGYQATTPLRLELTGETGLYSFGFERVESDVSILSKQTATPVPPTASPTPEPATETPIATPTAEVVTESGYPAPPASPTPLSPAEPWKDCARTPGLIGCDPSAPELAGHVAFYDLENSQLVGIDLKTGEGWSVAIPMPVSLDWSPDGSQLLARMNNPREEHGLYEYILFEKNGKLIQQFRENSYQYWLHNGASLGTLNDRKIVQSPNGEEAWIERGDQGKTLHYRQSANSEWQTVELTIWPPEWPHEIHGWLPGTSYIIISNGPSSVYNSVMHGGYIYLYNLQTGELVKGKDFHGHLDAQFSATQDSKLAIINLYGGMNDNMLAVLDVNTGEIDRPLPRQYNTEIQSYSLWQMAWQPRNEETEGLFALMVHMVETNWKGLVPSKMFPTGGIYLYNRTANQAQMIREIPKERVGGNFHFTADGQYLLYNEGPGEKRDATKLPQDAKTRMYVREIGTGKEWLLLELLANSGDFLGYFDWNLIAVSME